MKRKRDDPGADWRDKQSGGGWDASEREIEALKWAEAVKKRQKGDGAINVSHTHERKITGGGAGLGQPKQLPVQGVVTRLPNRQPLPVRSQPLPRGSLKAAPPPSTRKSYSNGNDRDVRDEYRPAPGGRDVRDEYRPTPVRAIMPVSSTQRSTSASGTSRLKSFPSRAGAPLRSPAPRVADPRGVPIRSYSSTKPSISKQPPSAPQKRSPPTADERQQVIQKINRLGTEKLRQYGREQLQAFGRSIGLPQAELSRTTDFLVQKLVRMAYNLQHAQQAKAAAPKPQLVKTMSSPEESVRRWVRCPLCQQAVQVPMAPGAYSCESCSGLFRC